MTDRELMEFAAKAVDLKKHRYCEAWKAMAEYTLQDGYYGPSWSPLTDDGDARRLAAKLRLDIGFHDTNGHVRAHPRSGPSSGYTMFVAEDYHAHSSIEAATRRAIVRAAAEIGKSK